MRVLLPRKGVDDDEESVAGHADHVRALLAVVLTVVNVIQRKRIIETREWLPRS
jgi:hypothetical protein